MRSTGEAGQPTARAVQIEATGNKTSSSVSSHGERIERSDHVTPTLAHTIRDFKAKLPKCSGSRKQGYTRRSEFEVFASIHKLTYIFHSSHSIRVIPMDMQGLVSSGIRREEIEEAEIAFFYALKAIKVRD